MFKYFLGFLLIILSSTIFSQANKPGETDYSSRYFIAVEEMPDPIGGVDSIQSKVYYTKEAKDAEIEGKIYTLVYINEKGDVDSTKILKGLGYGLDEVVSNGLMKLKFVPGKHKGRNVKVQVSIPVVFKLD
ncbi:MAG: TonB family protein [Ignavibacteriales bacterium]|nr:TonB family protein [Ignavibacteriales bacterium]